jgi:hypothetical protein
MTLTFATLVLIISGWSILLPAYFGNANITPSAVAQNSEGEDMDSLISEAYNVMA